MQVIKRNGTTQSFDWDKIENVIRKAFEAVGKDFSEAEYYDILDELYFGDENGVMRESISVEELQDQIEQSLFICGHFDVMKAFILYRDKHKELRFLKERSDYIDECTFSNDNTATLSEVDANANVQSKNVATIEAEVYKSLNKQIQRYKMKKRLQKMYPEVANQYEKDLKDRIIYTHDESSSPIPKPYCVAVSMYPFLLNGTSTLDGLKSKAPTNLNSFCGQFNNLIFLLSSQFKGAVAVGEFFNVFYYYCVKEWGENFWLKESEVHNCGSINHKTISETIDQCFQNIVYSLNQPAGNRSFQSPFTNISYYDSGYWHALFDEFVFPDGTKPVWEGVSYLQKKFMRWFNNERTKTLLTFPVESMSLLSDGTDIIDKEYKDFTAEMYAKGHSFFTYISDSPDALASCCRLRNEITKNEFSFTSGLTGVATGSVNVITLNINRIIQNFYSELEGEYNESFDCYLKDILSRIYKYHKAYRSLLEDLYKHDMLPVYSTDYISLSKQFSTIGINGINEAAMYLGMECSDNDDYYNFVDGIISIIDEQNRLNSDKNCRFNLEFVPAEGLGIKNYNWDKEEGYWVPEGRNCYTSYMFLPDDESIDVLQRCRLHGKRFTNKLSGGVALHCNLEEHLSKEQYIKLIDYAIKEGTSYFTFNIPNSECNNCKYITKSPIKKCPHCGSEDITWWTRIIGYLRPISAFSKGRQIEASKRIYSKQ
jgi:ribonucleoside-triphosphate reductase